MQVLRFLRSHVGDALIVLLFAGSEVSIWVNPNQAGPKVLLAFLVPLFLLPLLLRRRYPLAAPAAVLGSLVLASIVVGEVAQDGNGQLQILFATWWLADHGDRRWARSGLALAALASLAVAANDPSREWPELVAGPVSVGAVWLLGSYFSRRARSARELRERLERAERERELAVAEERARIARELHDVVAHSVSVMVVQAGGVRRLLDGDQERQREALQSIEQTGRAALVEMRRMLGVLRTDAAQPATLAPQPSIAQLDLLLEHVRAAGLEVDYRVEGNPQPVPPGVDLSVYRIVQEGLTNTLKHAGAGARADVTVRFDDHRVEVEVADDGAGPVDGDGLGHGLVGMRERVALYGGRLEAGARPGGGYMLRAVLPWESPDP